MLQISLLEILQVLISPWYGNEIFGCYSFIIHTKYFEDIERIAWSLKTAFCIMDIWVIHKNLKHSSLLLLCNLTLFQLYTHGEKFNQPIFLCNNISGLVEPVSTLGSILYGLPFFYWCEFVLFSYIPIIIPILTNPRWSQMTSTELCTQLTHLRFCSRKVAAGHLYLCSST